MSMYRFGKHPPKQDYRTLLLRNYLSAGFPAPPPACDVLASVYQQLGVSDPTVLFPIDANDSLGDCTIAALAHAITVYEGLIAKSTIMDVPAVIKLYYQLTNGLDSGLYELDVLNFWQSNQVFGNQILAFVKIDPKNHLHIQQAIQLFGGVYLGFQVHQNCLEDFHASQPWTPGTLTQDGHAVYAVGYDQSTVNVLTWGTTQKATWDLWDECVDEAYAILPPEAKSEDFDPGFNFDQLTTDLQQVAS